MSVQGLALPAAWLAVIALFGALEPDTFLTSANLQSILGSQAVLVVVTLGLLFPLSAGDYDLSVASTLTFAAMIVALLNARHGWPVAPAIVVALAAGLLVGAVNGALVTLLELESLVVTLGTGTFVSGVTLGDQRFEHDRRNLGRSGQPGDRLGPARHPALVLLRGRALRRRLARLRPCALGPTAAVHRRAVATWRG